MGLYKWWNDLGRSGEIVSGIVGLILIVLFFFTVGWYILLSILFIVVLLYSLDFWKETEKEAREKNLPLGLYRQAKYSRYFTSLAWLALCMLFLSIVELTSIMPCGVAITILVATLIRIQPIAEGKIEKIEKARKAEKRR